jgi:hypothetical protein
VFINNAGPFTMASVFPDPPKAHTNHRQPSVEGIEHKGRPTLTAITSFFVTFPPLSLVDLHYAL